MGLLRELQGAGHAVSIWHLAHNVQPTDFNSFYDYGPQNEMSGHYYTQLNVSLLHEHFHKESCIPPGKTRQ